MAKSRVFGTVKRPLNNITKRQSRDELANVTGTIYTYIHRLNIWHWRSSLLGNLHFRRDRGDVTENAGGDVVVTTGGDACARVHPPLLPTLTASGVVIVVGDSVNDRPYGLGQWHRSPDVRVLDSALSLNLYVYTEGQLTGTNRAAAVFKFSFPDLLAGYFRQNIILISPMIVSRAV